MGRGRTVKGEQMGRTAGGGAACAVVCLVLVLAACQTTPAGPTPVPSSTARVVPTAAPVTINPLPTASPLPTLAITPTPVPVNLSKWQTYADSGKLFSFRYPPDWGGRGYTQALTQTVQPLSVDTIWLRSPAGEAGPEFALLYNWPALDPTQPPSNATAWSSAAGLAKMFLYSSCMTTFDSPAPVTVAGEQTMGVKYLVQCDRLYAGYMVGIVHKGVNYGLVVDVPAEDWDAWRPTFEAILASFAFGT